MSLRQQVVETVESLPGKYRQVDLARMFAVSRERIRRIVDHEELADKVRKPPILTFNCYMCGKEKKQKPSYFKRAKRHFCSHRCLGRYIGQHYGFGATKVRTHNYRYWPGALFLSSLAFVRLLSIYGRRLIKRE